MALHNLTEFFKLSALLNYNLTASSFNRFQILALILDGKSMDSDKHINRNHKDVVMETLNYLLKAYSNKRRRLGPMAILHPLRATSLLSSAMDKIKLIDILSVLLHDVPEDITPKNFKNSDWKEMEAQIFTLLNRLDTADENELLIRLDSLTKRNHESYYNYIGRLLDNARDTPELVQTKLADRLDNTLDMRVDIRDPLDDVNFFERLFNIFFIKGYTPSEPQATHYPATPMNGSKRLYQLFKNIVLLSLIRKKKVINPESEVDLTLFATIAEASLKESQRIFLHLVDYHYRDIKKQREQVREVMNYCQEGLMGLATTPSRKYKIDGLFINYFAISDKKERNNKLEQLYKDKAMMIQTTIAFIVIFLNFIKVPEFCVHGIGTEGISPSKPMYGGPAHS